MLNVIKITYDDEFYNIQLSEPHKGLEGPFNRLNREEVWYYLDKLGLNEAETSGALMLVHHLKEMDIVITQKAD